MSCPENVVEINPTSSRSSRKREWEGGRRERGRRKGRGREEGGGREEGRGREGGTEGGGKGEGGREGEEKVSYSKMTCDSVVTQLSLPCILHTHSLSLVMVTTAPSTTSTQRGNRRWSISTGPRNPFSLGTRWNFAWPPAATTG